ncbi:hypothetical protein CDL15_Pgr027922 [Punica granatum]|uniref:Uncharacterized protein n=1 Tax=Punica granatum TaxID=22663 RepID=A0A218XIV4_PUNGR|nr:hypothetical protein CDL15_Pgr027922 [Punica granatum]PKI54474.1 hypothetical protein CRG98_025157 [Punica granatum]
MVPRDVLAPLRVHLDGSAMVPEASALPKVSKPFFLALHGPGLFHTVGCISTYVFFSKVAVFFIYVIKSAEESHTLVVLQLRQEGGKRPG